jgi:hypothetical protein
MLYSQLCTKRALRDVDTILKAMSRSDGCHGKAQSHILETWQLALLIPSNNQIKLFGRMKGQGGLRTASKCALGEAF